MSIDLEFFVNVVIARRRRKEMPRFVYAPTRTPECRKISSNDNNLEYEVNGEGAIVVKDEELREDYGIAYSSDHFVRGDGEATRSVNGTEETTTTTTTINKRRKRIVDEEEEFDAIIIHEKYD